MEGIARPALDPNPLGIHSSSGTNNMDTAICRVCMARERVMVNIFEAPPGSSTSIADMISQCTGIYISQRQAYPKIICRPCMLDAQKAYEFKQTFERSHQYFSQIKEEVCIILDDEEETDQIKDEFKIGFLKEEEPKESSFTDQMKNDPTEGPLLVEDQLLVSDFSDENPSEGTDDRDDNANSSAEDRPFKCSQCPKTFKRKDHLVRHLQIHTGVRPFHCEHCPKSFTQKHILKKHLYTHTGERPFKCSHCPRSFVQKCNQEAHIRMHTGERPYECSECPRSFSHLAQLRYHARKHTEYHCRQSFSDRSN